MKMGEGRNPEEELKGWEKKDSWLPHERTEITSANTEKFCAIARPKAPLYLIGYTDRKKLPVYASVSDGFTGKVKEKDGTVNEIDDGILHRVTPLSEDPPPAAA